MRVNERTHERLLRRGWTTKIHVKNNPKRFDEDGAAFYTPLKLTCMETYSDRVNIVSKLEVDENSVVIFEGKIITLKELSETTTIHLDAVKYRYSVNPHNSEWIVDDVDPLRKYEYENKMYTLAELAIMGKLHYTTMQSRLKKMSVPDALKTPPRYSKDTPWKFR